MKKVLVLCSRPPYPLNSGGQIRMFNNIKMLSKNYIVDLLYISNDNSQPESLIEMKKYCRNVHSFEFKKYKFILNTLLGLFRNSKPLQVNYYYFKEMQNWIDKNSNEYDLIFCNHIRTTEYVKNIKRFKIVDFVDSIAMNYEKALKNSSFLWKLVYLVECKRVREYEAYVNQTFDKSMVTSVIDSEYIEKTSKKQVKIINHFISKKIDFEKLANVIQEEKSICFLGKMNYEPNVNAVIYFANEILPKLKSKIPNIKFYVIGGSPTERIKKLTSQGIIITGFVDDIDTLISKMNLFVAPMISGSGIQTKILEAMLLKKCVVTTPIGAEGLENLTGDELIITKDSTDMIERIESLLLDSGKMKSVGERAYNYIKNNLTEESVSKEFLQYIEEDLK